MGRLETARYKSTEGAASMLENRATTKQLGDRKRGRGAVEANEEASGDSSDTSDEYCPD